MENNAAKKKASIEEEGFEVEATDKDAAKKKASIEEESFEEKKTDAKITAWETAFLGSVAPNKHSIEEENTVADVVVGTKSTTSQTNSATGEEVKDKKKKTCCFENCNKEVVVWPFQRAKGKVREWLAIARAAMSLERCV